jgi:hypothetical protein
MELSFSAEFLSSVLSLKLTQRLLKDLALANDINARIKSEKAISSSLNFAEGDIKWIYLPNFVINIISLNGSSFVHSIVYTDKLDACLN